MLILDSIGLCNSCNLNSNSLKSIGNHRYISSIMRIYIGVLSSYRHMRITSICPIVYADISTIVLSLNVLRYLDEDRLYLYVSSITCFRIKKSICLTYICKTSPKKVFTDPFYLFHGWRPATTMCRILRQHLNDDERGHPNTSQTSLQSYCGDCIF